MENKSTWIRADTHKRLKIQAAKRGGNLIDLMDYILSEWLNREEQLSANRTVDNAEKIYGS